MTNIKLFESKKVRTHWDEEEEQWYFAVVDVIEVLTGSNRPRKYWSDLKAKLKKEGSELSDFIGQLKMESSDGKMYTTDIANTEQILRLIQTIPSPRAEPFKVWLAQVGYDRIQEIEDPELAQKRMKELYEKKGLTKKTQNLRDNMTDLELIFTMLGEKVTTEISKNEKPNTFHKNKKVAKRGGSVAGNARKQTEKELGKSIISKENFLSLEKQIKSKKKKK